MNAKAPYVLIDVGNSRAKLALADEHTILEQRDVATSALSPLSLKAALSGWDVGRYIACSVVPSATEVLREVLGESLLELRHDTLRGIGIRYPEPAGIGPDRLANALALVKKYGAPGVVVDFGTAVTFDVVAEDGAYIGGVIAPGLRLMTDYLHERTALLPRVELKEPTSAIGKSTVEAILAGAALGYRGMIRGILEAIHRELGSPPDWLVVGTGGNAEWIATGVPEIRRVDPSLTLDGLRLFGNLHAEEPLAARG